jgi:WD40 repeat protein
MSERGLFICELSRCKMYFEKPIILPCGNTICQEHVQLSRTNVFKCEFCSEEHAIPLNGFPVNKALMKMIELNQHLSGLQKEAKQSYEKFNLIIHDFQQSDLINSDAYIFNYFFNLRRQIESHRDQFIEELNKKSENLIKKLNDLEKQCKVNVSKLDKISIDELKVNQMPKWYQKLRLPNLSQQELGELMVKLNTNCKDLPIKIQKYKSDLLINKTLSFQPFDNKQFGKLIVNERKIIVVNNEIKGVCLKTYNGHTKAVRCVKIIENSNKLISGSDDSTIKIWNLDTSKCERTLKGHLDCVGSLLLTKNSKLISGSFDASIKVWDLKTFKCLNTLKEEFKVICLSIISNNQFVSALVDGTINIWDLNSFNRASSFKAHDKSILCVKLVNDSRLITSSADKTIKVWDLNNKGCIRTLIGHSEAIFSMELNREGILISGCDDHTIKMWNIETGQCLNTYQQSGRIYSLKMLANNLLAIGYSGVSDNLKLIDLNKNQVVKDLVGHNNYVFGLEMLDNGQLISYSGDNTIKMWSLM